MGNTIEKSLADRFIMLSTAMLIQIFLDNCIQENVYRKKSD